MTTVRDIMHPAVVSISVRDTMATAAQQMRQRDVGALPICDGEGRPVGIVAGEFAQADELHTTAADIDVADALSMMQRYQLRRLPVTEGGRLIGIVTEADIARNLPAATTGEFVEHVCEQQLPLPTEPPAT
jgi:CBS domain-containing protein